MPDPLLTAAIREAYAAANDAALIHTITLRHAAYAEPLRCAQHTETVRLRDETGTWADYLPIPFTFSLPEVSESSATELRIELAAATREAIVALDAAVQAAGPITLEYRVWIDGDPDAPAWGPLALTVVEASATADRVSLRATAVDITNRAFPGEDYTPTRYPSLVT